ncbi:MAG: regulator of stationary/sporulation protein expression [Hyphomonadaceae bacterium]|nr:MAG: regulator of stationary/sporulation protein expression [Hyphomonadaceae bacterium]KAF0185021.1 MAG: regulator of stationary/sporulation protein expression [Hyphomonadaceae bacterium]
MNENLSKLTVKSQTVIPKNIREYLGLKTGDRIRYITRNNRVEIEKVKSQTEDDPFATFTEWATDNDEEAFGKL